jgi:hypothetical protein
MVQRHTDNILFSLDGNDVMRNRRVFDAGVKFAEGGHKAMAYFCDESGEGRLTEGAARHLAGFIKACIIDNSLLEGKQQAWASYSKQYAQRKKGKYKAGNKGYWELTGTLHDSIDIIWRGKHSRTVGIKRNVKVTRPSGRGSFSTAAVARLMEFGGGNNMPARSLFGPASLIFMHKYFPKWGRAAKRALSKTYAEYFKELRDKDINNINRLVQKNGKEEVLALLRETVAEVKDEEFIKKLFS